MNNSFRLLIVIFSFVMGLNAQSNLPIKTSDENIKPLKSLVDPKLQKTLIAELNKIPEWKMLIAEKKMAVGIVDLSDPIKTKYASVNGQYMMYAASLPKIAILLSAMDAIEKKELKETDEVKKDMRLMISKSDNQASTRMINRLSSTSFTSHR